MIILSLLLIILSLLLDGLSVCLIRNFIPFFTIIMIVIISLYDNSNKVIKILFITGIIYDLLYTDLLFIHGFIFIIIYILSKYILYKNNNFLMSLSSLIIIITLYSLFMSLYTLITTNLNMINIFLNICNSIFINIAYFIIIYLLYFVIFKFLSNTKKNIT